MFFCHSSTTSDSLSELPYKAVERWPYTYSFDQLIKEKAQHICVDEFALRKGYNYATSVLNAESGHILAIVPHRDQDAIETVLKKVIGKIQTVISDFAPAMAGAIKAVFSATIQVLDHFHLVQLFTDAQQRSIVNLIVRKCVNRRKMKVISTRKDNILRKIIPFVLEITA